MTYVQGHTTSPAARLQPDIHIAIVDYERVAHERLHARYRAILSNAERRQEMRYRRSQDRRRYLVSRALVRTALSKFAPVEPEDWIFSTTAHGRPVIANGGDGLDGLSFNLAHTHSLIVLTVTKRRAIGVDVEGARGRTNLRIAARYFAPDEVTALDALPADRQPERFLEYWTLKEAYIKARGLGLSLPLNKFSFHFQREGRLKMAVQAELADDAERWQFWQFRPTPEYLVAVCAERASEAPVTLALTNVIPMMSEEPLTPKYIRMSGDRPS